MTRDELRTIYPNASQDFFDLNSGPVALVESNPRPRTVGQVQAQGGDGRRFLVVVKSFRRRLLDEDNLCCKYIVDLCRYAGIIPSDAPGTTTIKVCQGKVTKGEPEKTTVEVFKI